MGQTEQPLTGLDLDSVYLVVGSESGLIHVWTTRGTIPAPMGSLEGHKKGVTAVRMLNRARCLSSSYDCTLRLWCLKGRMRCLAVLKGHCDFVRCLTVQRPSFRFAASGDFGGFVRVWDLARVEELLHEEQKIVHLREQRRKLKELGRGRHEQHHTASRTATGVDDQEDDIVVEVLEHRSFMPHRGSLCWGTIAEDKALKIHGQIAVALEWILFAFRSRHVGSMQQLPDGDRVKGQVGGHWRFPADRAMIAWLFRPTPRVGE